jgi:hypothetical protein
VACGEGESRANSYSAAAAEEVLMMEQMQTLAVERRAVADSPLDGLLAWFTGQQPLKHPKLPKSRISRQNDTN